MKTKNNFDGISDKRNVWQYKKSSVWPGKWETANFNDVIVECRGI